ncbi:ribonuclease H-like domain-containing protein [Tanacetum coccineum]|uniref:Ribonuclease H-like domain-containing protein n=1 Tax=Tanacetum coccineum TaxID=301880 RepID=A0ABQ5CUG3_9ASTR
MVTCAQVGTVKPNPRFNFPTSHISPLPKSPSIALSDPNWRVVMYDEYNALVKNSTWRVAMWLFRHKYHEDRSLSRYKARLVANGRTQQVGIDCDDTFSPVVKPATIRTVLSLALSRKWLVPRAWFQRFVSYALRVGFSSSRCDYSLFIYRHGTEVAYLLIYVDDIVLTASSTDLLQCIISSLHEEFDMTDLGALNYFLRISVTRDSTCIFLSQKKYALELLDRVHMANCNPTRMPVDTESKLGFDGDPISDHTLYRNLAGALKRVLRYVRSTLDFRLQLYTSITGSLVAYTNADWAGCSTTRRSSAKAEYKGVANVVAETAWLRNLLLELYTPLLSATIVYYDNVSAIYMTANPVQHQRTKHIEIDIHFVRDMVARGGLHLVIVFFGRDNLLSWSAKRQHTLSRSSAKAEYKGVANVVAETAWLRNLLLELYTPLLSATIVYYDNVSAIYMTANPVQHQRTKHIEIDIHFVRDMVARG